MRIILIQPYYAPDLGANSPLFTMLSEDLVKLGNEVSVICAVPHLPTGRVWDGYRRRLAVRQHRNGVDVTRVWVPSVDRSRVTPRLFTFAALQALTTAIGVFRRFDVVLSSNPAIETGLPFIALTALRRKPGLYCMQDVYPDVGVRIGLFRQPWLIRLIEFSEKLCLRRAKRVRVLCPSFLDTYGAKGVPRDKMVVIHDYVDPDEIHPLPKNNQFAAAHALESKFVVMYAGNVGLSQGLDMVLETASRMRGDTGVRFVIVGDGADNERLRAIAKDRELQNVQFLPFQPREALPQVLAAADVSVISLKPGFGADALPSKIYPILASGRPIIASVDEHCDTWDMVESSECGIVVRPGDAAALEGAVVRLRDNADLRRRLGANGRSAAVNTYSRRTAAQAFDSALRSITGLQAAP